MPRRWWCGGWGRPRDRRRAGTPGTTHGRVRDAHGVQWREAAGVVARARRRGSEVGCADQRLLDHRACVCDVGAAGVPRPTPLAAGWRQLSWPVVYRERPDCVGIVHLHSTYAVAYSCLGGRDPADALPPLTPYAAMRLGRVPLVGYVRPGDMRLAQLVGERARDHRAILLANHGSLLAGETLEAAEELTVAYRYPGFRRTR
ncbi:aldolase [bacterium]|nr:MAG: aldolase [bacterium]